MSVIEEKIKVGAKVIDVRTREEFEEEAYPGAINIPIDEMQSRFEEFGSLESPIVLYCATGSRSAFVTRILKNNGYKDVINAGGLEDMPIM